MPGAGGDDGHDDRDDRDLITAVRGRSETALREFVLRYRPMLIVAARRLGVWEGEQEVIADEVLHEAALRLIDPTTPTPRAIRGYLLRSLRNRVVNAARGRIRRGRTATSATDVAGDAEPYFEQAVVGCASEHAVRASHGPAWDGAPMVAPALARLAVALMAPLSPEDRLLVVWLSHQVPQHEIAAWLGASYDATLKRIRRLRARLQRAATRYTEQLDPAARAEVLKFLGRAARAAGRRSSSPRPVPSRAPRGHHHPEREDSNDTTTPTSTA